MNDNEAYQTSDFALASYLNIQHPVKDLDRTDPRRCQFIFEDSQKLQEEIKKFWDRTAEVEPKEFFNSMNILKTRLYNR